MRTRTRSLALSRHVIGATPSLSFSIRKCSDGSVTPGTQSVGAIDVVTDGLYERIDDETGKGKVNSVRHRRSRVILGSFRGERTASHTDPNGYGITTYQGLGPYWPSHFANVAVNYRNWENVLSPLYFTQTPYRWELDYTSIDEALMMNEVRDAARQLKADVLLNLVEANQTWSGVKSMISYFPQMRDNWHRWRKAIKLYSGTVLAWKFGVAPILSDTLNVLKYLPKLGSDLDAHRKADSRRFSRMAVVPLRFNPEHRVWQSANGVETIATDSQGRTVGKSEIRYVLVVKPVWSGGDGVLSAIDHALRRFATSPTRLAWEKIPFSFMADWFVDLRGAFDKIDRSIGVEPYRVVGFSRSTRYHVETDIHTKWKSVCNGATLHDLHAATIEYRHYERSVASASAMPLWRPRFGKSQAGITALLIAQQLAKLRR